MNLMHSGKGVHQWQFDAACDESCGYGRCSCT
jgi:hypothetical protein